MAHSTNVGATMIRIQIKVPRQYSNAFKKRALIFVYFTLFRKFVCQLAQKVVGSEATEELQLTIILKIRPP
jgi:hypothetical protein